MIQEIFDNNRSVKVINKETDLVVIGGGLTGVSCAITAARAGVKVVLIQDRPVLGGNSSSEVRLWPLGATSHQGNNNRWAREGGVINELFVENIYRNKEGNPIFWDMVLLDKVRAEENIILHLNTIMTDVKKDTVDHIQSIEAFNPANETRYVYTAKQFVDASGDGILSYLAGVPYRIGAEEAEEFNEGFAPDKEKYGEVMGHSIFFYMKDTGKSVKYEAPEIALKDVEQHIPKIQNSEYFSIHHHGCKYWWVEYGGRLDTIHDTEEIKYELWKVVYGIWDYIKNSGKFPEMDTYTLEWAGLIPGKRESRRFEGVYTLHQRDIIEQTAHEDAVAFGGWSIDLHPADGVYAGGRGCNQWHSKGVYQIPLSCYITKTISNLMFGGRIASSTHVANGSTRVMATSAHGAQGIGMAAAMAIQQELNPIDMLASDKIKEVQRALIETGQHIPLMPLSVENNLADEATVTPSSTLNFKGLTHDGEFISLKQAAALLLPVEGKLPTASIKVRATEATTVEVSIRVSEKDGNYTPDETLETLTVDVPAGESVVRLPFTVSLDKKRYVFITFASNEAVCVARSSQLVSSVMTVYNLVNIAVSNFGRQDPPAGIGVEAFEFWCPKRRPEGQNVAIQFDEPLAIYSVEELASPYFRPHCGTNAWAAAFDDVAPQLVYTWEDKKAVSSVRVFCDVDYDHAMETAQMGHCDHAMPQCISSIRVSLPDGTILNETQNNHNMMVDLEWPTVETDQLIVEVSHPSDRVPAAVFGVILK